MAPTATPKIPPPPSPSNHPDSRNDPPCITHDTELSSCHVNLPSSAVTAKDSPFRNVVPDCLHVVFHYHVFTVEDLMNVWEFYPLVDDDNAQENSSTFSIAANDAPWDDDDNDDKEWRFLQHYAHCFCLYGNPLHHTTHSIPHPDNHYNYNNNNKTIASHILSKCRHWDKSPSFYYIALEVGGLELGSADNGGGGNKCMTWGHLFRYLRGVQHLEIFWKSNRGVRGADGMDPSFILQQRQYDALFPNLRNVKTLSLHGFRSPLRGRHLENLRGIHELQLHQYHFNNLSPEMFANLRGIRKLFMSSRVFTPTGEHLMELRGIQDLEFSLCHGHSLTDSSFKNLRGISRFRIHRDISKTDVAPDNDKITDAAMIHLRGATEICLVGLDSLTSAALKQLRGVHHLTLSDCSDIKLDADSLRNLRGIKSLCWTSSDESRYPVVLSEESLKQLCGVTSLYLHDVVPISSEAFRYLQDVTFLVMKGRYYPLCGAEFTVVPLYAKVFSYLKSVKWCQLLDVPLYSVTDFSAVVVDAMPQVEYFGVENSMIRLWNLKPPREVHEQFEVGELFSATFEYKQSSMLEGNEKPIQ